MKSLAVRLTLLSLFVVSTGVAAYIFWTGEARTRTDAMAARAFGEAAIGAGRDVLELRAAQQAYVAAGQGEQFWMSKVAAAIGALRDRLSTLRGQAMTVAAQSACPDPGSRAAVHTTTTPAYGWCSASSTGTSWSARRVVPTRS